MFIVHFTSGLGNQLFQYNFGQFLKQNFDKEEVFYANSLLPPKQISIWDIFNNDINWIRNKNNNEDIFSLKKFLRVSSLKLSIRLNFSKLFNIYSDENFDKINFFKNNKKLSFYGYWQKSAFYKDPITDITKSLKFNKQVLLRDILPMNLKDKILIAIHIRGGDYLNPKNKKVFVNLKSDYYKQNIKKISSSFSNTCFLIFSDDYEYARYLIYNMDEQIYFMDSFNKNSLNDFQLLSQCDHFILSNSTFAWWAEKFSNQKKEKITIYPKDWFLDNNEYFNLD